MNRDTQEPISKRWQEIATIAKDEARKLPPCPERDALLKKARQLETAAHINEWVLSPGLRPPAGK